MQPVAAHPTSSDHAPAQPLGRFREALHIFVLSGFALAQPLLYQLCRRVVYLQDEGIERAAVLIATLVVCLAIPALFVALEWALGAIGPKWRRAAHHAVAWFFMWCVALPPLKRVVFLGGYIQVALACAIAAAGVWLYGRSQSIRSMVSLAAPVQIGALALFVFYSPVSAVLFPRPAPVPAAVPVRNPTPIVILLFDEFCGTSLMNERREIDAVRYPHFAALARESTWYRNFSTVHARTEMAVPALLTGMRPRGTRPATVAQYPDNLFALLYRTQLYEMVAFEPYTRLFPAEADPEEPPPRLGLAEQLRSLRGTMPAAYYEYLLPADLPVPRADIPHVWFGIRPVKRRNEQRTSGVFRYPWDSRRDEQFAHFLRCIVPTSRPRLHFSHIVLPHFPWRYYASGRKYSREAGIEASPIGGSDEWNETWVQDDHVVMQAHQRYLLQVAYADRLLGELVERLRALHLYDRCLLIVTSDHGVSFRPGMSRRLAVGAAVPDIVSAVLLVKLPGQRAGSTSDRNVESIDVFPTIADVIGLDVDSRDGQSLLDASRPERPNKAYDTGAGPILLDAPFQSKYDTLRSMIERFGSGGSDDRLFRVGPHAELVGRNLRELPVGDEVSIEMDLRAFLTRRLEDPRELAPGYFVGRVVSATASRPVHLAIAVNGRIEAVTRTTIDPAGVAARDSWTALVPETAFRLGENQVQILSVTTTNGRLELHPLAEKLLHGKRPSPAALKR
jgi:hypothetical protein